MKRRTFIATASLAIVAIPVAYYFKKNAYKVNYLWMPDLLSNFCDEKAIREIGNDYRKMNPAENEKKKLTDLILSDAKGGGKIHSDDNDIREKLNNKIHNNFEEHNTIVIRGWIISLTEARQCALFSFTKNTD